MIIGLKKEDFTVYKVKTKYVLTPREINLEKWKVKPIKKVSEEEIEGKNFDFFVYLKDDGVYQKVRVQSNLLIEEMIEKYSGYWKNLHLETLSKDEFIIYELSEEIYFIPKKICDDFFEKQNVRIEVDEKPDHYLGLNKQNIFEIRSFKEVYNNLDIEELIQIHSKKWEDLKKFETIIGEYNVYESREMKILIPDFITLKRIGLEDARVVNSNPKYYIAPKEGNVVIEKFSDKYSDVSLEQIVKEHSEIWKKLYKLSLTTKLNKFNSNDKTPKNKVSIAEKEGKRLKETLPNILLKLGLENIEGDNEYIYSYSKIGDELLRNDLREFNLKNKLQTELNSNLQQKWALIRLGFDFLDISDHMGGTYFEVLYALAHEQNKQNVKNLLLKSLLGDLYIDKNKFINWLKNLLRKK
ncbi:MAG: hypothetical protein Q3988_06645 [Gemella sp.]|nr:hypothetical protein [Gemella sp.]